MTFEEKRTIRNKITNRVEQMIDRIVANDQSSDDEKETVLEALECNARQLAACVVAEMEIPEEDWREFREHAEFEIKYNSREYLIQMARI